ncbi:MAG: hypothetical protein JXN61_06350 [Sedimentisphaerales bacterium]|nr:hypothetical protein [Sedimentisphaerales bacterium]
MSLVLATFAGLQKAHFMRFGSDFSKTFNVTAIEAARQGFFAAFMDLRCIQTTASLPKRVATATIAGQTVSFELTYGAIWLN